MLKNKMLIMNKMILLIAFIGHVFTINAQINEEKMAMSVGVNNAVMLDIPDSKAKIVEKVWKNFSKDFNSKTKKDKKTDEWVTQNPIIRGFSAVNVNTLYARIEDGAGNSKLTLWFELDGDFLNSEDYPEEYEAAQMLLLNFGIEVAKEYTLMELNEEEKNMKKLETNLKKLTKDKENYEKSIEDYKAKIVKAEENIEQNIVEQASAKQSIEDQMNIIEKVKKKLAELDN